MINFPPLVNRINSDGVNAPHFRAPPFPMFGWSPRKPRCRFGEGTFANVARVDKITMRLTSKPSSADGYLAPLRSSGGANSLFSLGGTSAWNAGGLVGVRIYFVQRIVVPMGERVLGALPAVGLTWVQRPNIDCRSTA